MFGVQNSLKIRLCKDAADAVEQGFVYKRPEYLPMEIKHVVIVENGTVSNNPTVDLVLVDENGQHYTVMLTAALWNMVTSCTEKP
jgi:hypothetical protein